MLLQLLVDYRPLLAMGREFRVLYRKIVSPDISLSGLQRDVLGVKFIGNELVIDFVAMLLGILAGL